MLKVLIVEDEPGYRDLTSRVLSGRDHQTMTASSGREALDLAVRYQPDVVIADWMLKDRIHGLHIVNILRAILPETRAVIMTGFPSADLRQSADEAGVHTVLEKPFDAKQLRAAMTQAAHRGEREVPPIRLAVMEIDATGTIYFTNQAARDLMQLTSGGKNATSLTDLIFDEVVTVVREAMDEWIAVSPRVEGRMGWELRSQKTLTESNRLIVIRRLGESRRVERALIEMLLGVKDVEKNCWPLDGRLLIVDNDILLRTAVTSMLESAGAGCYAVEKTDEALRLLKHDEKLLYVLLDFEIPGIDLRSMIGQIRALRPDVTLIGHSGSGRRAEFAAMGVDRYLDKPWQIKDLIGLLTPGVNG